MRRKILKNNNITIALCFVALFTGLSFVFDQRVVQQESKIRNIESQISNSKITLQKNLFLMNSLFSLSKELSFLGQIKKNILDDTMLRRSFFKDYVDYPDLHKDFKPFRNTNKIGSQKLTDIHTKIFKDVIKSHNKKVDQVSYYLNIFNQNQSFLDIVKDFDLSNFKKDNFESFYISNNEVKDIPFDEVLPYELTATDKHSLYKSYSKFRDKIHEFSNIGDDMHGISMELMLLHEDNFRLYEKVLIDYSKMKNDKNLFILFSILFQILGLTSLMFLFKIIINQEKK